MFSFVMTPHSSTLAWKIPWTEGPGGLQSMGSLGVRHDWATSLSLFTFHFHALGKEMATHSSVLAWRIPGTAEPGGVPSMGSHRVGHDWSDLAAAALQVSIEPHSQVLSFSISHKISTPYFYCWLLDHITNNITLKFMWKVIVFFFLLLSLPNVEMS